MKTFKLFNYGLVALVLGFTLSLTSCKKKGCTDDRAENFDSNAKKDDGSCVYPTVVVDNPADDDDIAEPQNKKANTEGLTLITSADITDANAKIELYAMQDLYPGMNLLYVAAYDLESNELLSKGNISFEPMMEMNTGMKHGAPVINDTKGGANSNGLFHGQVFFVMPSTAGKWMLKTKFHNHQSGTEGSVELAVSVAPGDNQMMVSFVDTTTTDSNAIFLSYALKEKPTVGSNDFTVVAFYRKSMMDWPAADDLKIKFEPQMPSMGHGSDNNEDPAFKENGTYYGKVNYSMSGKWQLDLTVMRDTKVLNDKLYFTYNVTN